jgi:hypothetical protein
VRLLVPALVLLAQGCNNPPPPQAKPEVAIDSSSPSDEAQAEQALGPQASKSTPPPPEFKAADTAPAKGADLHLGMSRADLLAVLGRCAQRVVFEAGGPSAKTVEIFQPEGEACVKEFGARQFIVAADRFTEQIDSLNTAPSPRPPSRERARGL